MIAGLPEVVLRTGGHPVAVESPHFHECVTLPREFVLMPGLRSGGSGCVRARFRFHIHIVAFDERHLIVREQVAAIERLLIRYEWVVHGICQDLIKFLAVDVEKTRVLRVLRPLGPAWTLRLCEGSR